MRLWTVYEPRNPASAGERADKTVFLKDGFSWPGLIFPLPWLLIQRLWLGTLFYLLIVAATSAAGYYLPLDDDAGLVLALLGNVYVALEGNDMRRRKLARLGFVQAGSVLARSRAEAELIFFAERAPAAIAPVSPAAARIRPAPVSARPPPAPDVLGLFPSPGGQR